MLVVVSTQLDCYKLRNEVITSKDFKVLHEA